jgi:hypothetical protein
MIGMLEKEFLRFNATGRVNVYSNTRIFQFAKDGIDIMVEWRLNRSIAVQFSP